MFHSFGYSKGSDLAERIGLIRESSLLLYTNRQKDSMARLSRSDGRHSSMPCHFTA